MFNMFDKSHRRATGLPLNQIIHSYKHLRVRCHHFRAFNNLVNFRAQKHLLRFVQCLLLQCIRVIVIDELSLSIVLREILNYLFEFLPLVEDRLVFGE
jgi:hypothetical protein